MKCLNTKILAVFKTFFYIKLTLTRLNRDGLNTFVHSILIPVPKLLKLKSLLSPSNRQQVQNLLRQHCLHPCLNPNNLPMILFKILLEAGIIIMCMLEL